MKEGITMNNYIERAENALLHTYNRYPVVFEKGDGVYLYDTDGKKYLDFGSGIGVFALGYNYKPFNDAVKEQVDRLIHTSNYFYNVPATEAAEKIIRATGLEKVFLTNSGAEAVEGAIKAAVKYAWLKDGRDDHEIIAMEHSFHGRTCGALSVTGNAKYREAFKPMIGKVRFADYNDLDSVRALVNDKTCAVIMETVQGEGGVYPAEDAFIRGVRQICDENDMLLILDEIQCGMGRTGYMFAYQKYGVTPDIVTCAKALSCGIPAGAFVLGKKAAEHSLVAGDHGTTYGGNPLAGQAIATVFDLYEKLNLTEHVQEISSYFLKKLDMLVEKYDFVKGHRGMGLMQGLVFEGVAPGEAVKKLLEKGAVAFTAGTDVLRFLPPLVIEKAHVDEMTEKLDSVLEEICLSL